MMGYTVICRFLCQLPKAPYYCAMVAALKNDRLFGEVAEWSNASDLKSDEAKTSGGSNPPLSVVCNMAQNHILVSH
jgi:hypothetical protein